jgi:chemosensory pili system protein ChpB (putative protein-glutamate methylesterase)
MAEAPRVALLAGPGAACERLRAALREAGGEIVLEADPAGLAVETLRAAVPQAVLVALDARVEDVIDRFADVLGDPAITVIFDEAELAARREGWDAARWVRHLTAKLQGHDDVLPPGREPAEPGQEQPRLSPPPGRPQAAEQRRAEAPIAPLVEETRSHGAEASPEPVPDGADADRRFARDLADLERRGMELAPVEAAPPAARAPPRGAVLVLAGIGGPDAVRQLLAALPADFPRPVLVLQRLDGARYDRLVQQMTRAAALPVRLADAGMEIVAATVYIVPPELGVASGESGLRFVTDAPLLAALAAADSAVLMLSGADPALVGDALQHAAHGALVAGQAPEGCYDAAAAIALIARGEQAATPAGLAALLRQRWPG